MRVSLMRYPSESDWIICKECALVTVGLRTINPPTGKWKRQILRARHSPIRELKFIFFIEDVPSYVATHLARHIHAQPYIKSQRNDRQSDYDRNSARQDAPVNMMYSVNAEELMTIANKRLCNLADQTTRKVVREMCICASTNVPEIGEFLVPMCEHQGGQCHEIYPCYKEEK